MSLSIEEKKLIEKVRSGVKDGPVLKDVVLDNGDVIRYEIKRGLIGLYRHKKEDGGMCVVKDWITDHEILSFLQKNGYLMSDPDVREYSARSVRG